MPKKQEEVLPEWEKRTISAVGEVIEFWGFKRNHGRLWALLYLRGEPLTAQALQRKLGLSKGAVSMLTRDLEQWQVLERVRHPDDAQWSFAASHDLMAMIGRVLQQRELKLTERVHTDLTIARRTALEDSSVEPAVIDRLARMHALAQLARAAVTTLIESARIDVRAATGLLDYTGFGRGEEEP